MALLNSLVDLTKIFITQNDNLIDYIDYLISIRSIPALVSSFI